MPQRQTLADSTVQVLREQLDSGRWTDVLPGERQLCEEYQISRPTLRQALRVLEREGRIQVAHGCQRRIVQPAASTVSAAGRNVIGILSPVALQALPPFALFWIDEVRSHLAKVGCRLEFHASSACAAHHPDKALEGLVRSAPASLWILLLSTPHAQGWFAQRKIPCLVTGSCSPEVDLTSIDIDYRAACRHAVGMFRSRGHSQLALVIPAEGLGGDAESEAGFLEGTAGGPPPLILHHNSSRQDVMRKVENSLKLPSPPTGFLVARAGHTLTVLTLLMGRGLRVPNDVAVISRDDDVFLHFVTPAMARYTTNRVVFARRLSRTILHMVQSGPTSRQTLRLMPQFIQGRTI